MSSVVDVCNKALDKLGAGSITSLTDGNKVANLCSRNWPLIRDQVLRDHPWNFAVARATLAPSATAPEWGFAYIHSFPTNLVKLLEVKDLTSESYEVEGRSILADDDVLYIRYIYRVEDPTLYDNLFIDAVSTRLAFELCEGLTQSNTKKEALWAEYLDSLNRAKRSDAVENPTTGFEEDDWITARL